MSQEFWRTIRTAFENDNWTARLVVILFTTSHSVSRPVAAVRHTIHP
ncbi:hypothetical protein QQY66_02430 [Streptomyces sp. DG2A-72]|nr:hypothetical protein [Streptomyces sp. DG2A-72]MDO0930594.1 hypothetical protein [Streptomyces sp. DG2A-72]